MKKNFKITAAITLTLVSVGLLISHWTRGPSREITRAQLLEAIEHGTIANATALPTFYENIYTVEGALNGGPKPKPFSVTTHLTEAQLAELFATAAVKVQVPGRDSKTQWVNVIAILVIAGLAVMIILHQSNLGKSKTSHQVRERPTVRLSDVAGIEEAKAEVQEVIDFLRHPKKYKKLGGKLPKGILLIGPPGTGKTMLAKAIAGEARANFFSAHGSDFNEMFVGVGARRVRDIFRKAAKSKPAIIFIDEIDCLGKKRQLDAHGELQQTNNALLAAMDGFASSEGIIVLAATNRPEDLDDALTRPGRFDRKVYVPYPDMKGRRAILEVHARNKPLSDASKALDVIARTTPGMSGADLANLINEAAIFTAQQNTSRITLADLEAARDKVRFGKERKSMVLKQNERAMVAYHEAGHAVINLRKTLMPPLYKVSIIPRGQALGVTTLLPDEDQNIHSKDLLLEELVVLMGGRAAEKVFYGATTNGAAGDLQTARTIARKMVLEWGMGDRLYYEPDKREAEEEINRLLEEADREALTIIETHRKNTQKLAEALLVRETLTKAEVLELFDQKSPGEETFGFEYFPV
ncbi:MAG: AAA family ATPase [Verrucomicrobia subdivision 3 bacterium]|nr:AAA family ATPase [Limisphaerales bacterium]